MATIYIETHGCQMNEADSQYIVRRATGAGYALAERAEDASVLVLNTCTVRDNAEKRAYGRIHHWKAIKRRRSVGARRRRRVSGRTGSRPHGGPGQRTSTASSARATCARWAISSKRGGRSSPTTGDVVERELDTVIGGTSDGVDRTLRRAARVRQRAARLFVLLHVLHRAARARPLRPSADDARSSTRCGGRSRPARARSCWSDRPSTPTKNRPTGPTSPTCSRKSPRSTASSGSRSSRRTRRIWSRSWRASSRRLPKMNPRFHLAVQSGSNPVLRRMNRKYTVEEFRDRIAMFLSYNPNWAITTDIIVGFPGETEADFAGRRSTCARPECSRKRTCSCTRRAAARRRRTGNRSRRTSQRERFARLVAVTGRPRARLPRPQDRYDRARAHPRRFAQRPGAFGGQDDRQRDRAFPDDRRARPTWPNRGSTSRSIARRCGASRASRRARAGGWNAPARPLAAPVIDLVGMR